MNDNQFDLETHQLLRQDAKAFHTSFRPSHLDADVLSLNPTEVAETLSERL